MHPLEKFRFCPVCGSSKWEIHNFKSKQCGDCGFTYYGNPSAANVALIINEKDELLVVRRKKDPAKGTLDLPGGFTDMEESGEQGVIREVLEETGLVVRRAEYLLSLPNLYEYSGDAEDARWIPISQLRPEEFGLRSIREGITRLLQEGLFEG